MIIADNVAINELKETLESTRYLVITDGFVVGPELPNLLNTLIHFLPQFKMLLVETPKNTVKFANDDTNLTTTQTYTAVELLHTLAVSEIPLTDSHFTVRNTMNGLIYSPYSDTALYYTRANNSLLRADCTQIPFKDVHNYLKNASSMYTKYLKAFVPEVALIEQRKQSSIDASQAARGFPDGISEGMLVRIRDYDAMVEEYGERPFKLPENTSSTLVKASSLTYGLPFMKPFAYLREHIAMVTNINKHTGIIELSLEVDGKNIFKTSDIVVGSFTASLDRPIIFHEQHVESI